MAGAILEAVETALNGEAASDFMSSFSVVRQIEDLVRERYLCKCSAGEMAETRAVLPERNMYGCLPCPKCGSKFRWPTQDRTIQCDDCGLIEASFPDTDTAPSPSGE
jgi:hypothetical protein